MAADVQGSANKVNPPLRTTDRRTALLDAAVQNIARKGARGLRVEEVARSAGVSVALIYHYFPDRSTLLREALVHVAEKADTYTSADAPSARAELTSVLLGEIQDRPEVRDNSAAWGELRDTAIFNEELRATLTRYTRQWIDDLAGIIRRGFDDGSIQQTIDPERVGQRLTALTEGVSSRWLAGLLSTAEARDLLEEAVLRELGAG